MQTGQRLSRHKQMTYISAKIAPEEFFLCWLSNVHWLVRANLTYLIESKHSINSNEKKIAHFSNNKFIWNLYHLFIFYAHVIRKNFLRHNLGYIKRKTGFFKWATFLPWHFSEIIQTLDITSCYARFSKTRFFLSVHSDRLTGGAEANFFIGGGTKKF